MAVVKVIEESNLGSYMDYNNIESGKVNPLLPAVNLVPITYVPTSTGNTSNRNEIVTDPNGTKWFIDYAGDAVILGSGTKYAKVNIGTSVITNTGAVVNQLTGFTANLDTIGITVNNDNIVLPTGLFEVEFFINMFDNNSARVAHRTILYSDGTEVSRLEGNN